MVEIQKKNKDSSSRQAIRALCPQYSSTRLSHSPTSFTCSPSGEWWLPWSLDPRKQCTGEWARWPGPKKHGSLTFPGKCRRSLQAWRQAFTTNNRGKVKDYFRPQSPGRRSPKYLTIKLCFYAQAQAERTQRRPGAGKQQEPNYKVHVRGALVR